MLYSFLNFFQHKNFITFSLLFFSNNTSAITLCTCSSLPDLWKAKSLPCTAGFAILFCDSS
jgi:hypothetical protein